MTRITRLCLMAAALAGIATSSSTAARAQGAAGKPTVAILYFNNNAFGKDARDYDGLSKGIPDFLITEMAGNPAIRVVERDQIQRLLEEQKLSTDGRIDQATAARLGKLLGAQHMIFGGFMSDPGGNFRIDARSVNVETGQIEHTERVQDKADNVMTLIARLASKLNGGLNLPALPARTGDAGAGAANGLATQAGAPTAAPREKLPMKYAVMYGKALDLADKGDRTKAVELFGAVLKDFPDFTPARTAQARLKTGS